MNPDVPLTLAAVAILVAVTAFFIWQLLLWTSEKAADRAAADAERVDRWHADVAYWNQRALSTNPAERLLATQMLTYLWGHRPDREMSRV